MIRRRRARREASGHEPHKVELRGLRVLARCGVSLDERAHPQPLEIDLDLVCDLSAAEVSDELADTVDYAAVCELVDRISQGEPVALLEYLASHVADALLSFDQRVEQVVVAVRKLRPPVPHDLATAGVRIERQRS